ncbi:MAG: glycyl-radical enzyme activating protein [Bacteroidales bacterium]|nr:glycyl-radical enzyme activating protein [Bacteroidales bacterium]MDZ4204759.1 glycyl-radical enzyme activating protein [Bacteroidales bacterium]
MLGLVFDIRSFAVHDGPGIRQTIFFKGCPLRCAWCHNPEGQEDAPEPMFMSRRIGKTSFSKEETAGSWRSVEDIMVCVKEDIPFFEESAGGVTLSGGEPLMQPVFARLLLKACKELGIHTVVDTCGFAPPKVFESLMPYTNLFLYDLKLADPKQHIQCTGVGNELIINNLKMLASSGKNIIIRIPLIPGITDTVLNLAGLRLIIATLPSITRIDLLPYHTVAQGKYQRMGKLEPLQGKAKYDRTKAEQIKIFFQHLAPIVSIGG